MKARPILFSAAMIRALLAGTKTQTRRVMKPQPVSGSVSWGCIGGQGFGFIDADRVFHCPYGQLGDLLWVRETWAPRADEESSFRRWFLHSEPERTGPRPECLFAADGGDPFIERWRPSIHMPRAVSRLTLRITDVRVQRLKDIDGLDAIAEGLSSRDTPGNSWHWDRDATLGFSAPWRAYRALWESINGEGSWATNPWVWALTFEVIKTNVDEVLKVAA